MTHIQYAWMIYAAGALGCCIAAWWMLLWAWRFLRYSVVVTVMVILFTPYAIDQETMTMAPAIYTLVFDGLSQGIEAIKPLLKLMVGIWLIGIILVALIVFFTRGWARHYEADTYDYGEPMDNLGGSYDVNRQTSVRRRVSHPRYKNTDNNDLNEEEQDARKQLLSGDIPIRATRD